MKGQGNQLVIPKTGSLWYGSQDTLDAHNNVQLTMAELSPMELSNLRVRATELLATQGVSRDQFADHYMITENTRATGTTAGKQVLFPGTGAVGNIERMDRTFFVGHENVLFVQIQPPGA